MADNRAFLDLVKGLGNEDIMPEEYPELLGKLSTGSLHAPVHKIEAAIESLSKVTDDPNLIHQLHLVKDELKERLGPLAAAPKTPTFGNLFSGPPSNVHAAMQHLQKKMGVEMVPYADLDGHRIGGFDVRARDGHLFVDNIDVTEFVKQNREKLVGYREATYAPPLAPSVKTTWISRLLRRMVAWLEKEV